jgi:hypothetical protein
LGEGGSDTVDLETLSAIVAHAGRAPLEHDWAGKTLPVLQHHLEMAQNVNQNRK